MLKKKINSIIAKALASSVWFNKVWARHIKNNSKYDKDRYKYAYSLSSRKSKEKYWVFRYSTPAWGILAVARNMLLACEWAEKNGMIPIIDFEWECFYQDGLLGHDNLWEYIFEPPVPISKVIREKNVFVGTIGERYSNAEARREIAGSEKTDLITIHDGSDWREYYQKLNLYSKKWWKMRDDVQERIQKTYAKLFKKEMKILGVALREEFAMKKEDIKGTRLEQHPQQYSVDEMIGIIREYKEKWECTHVFATTYMEDSIEKLRDEFGEALLFTDRKRVRFDDFVIARKKAEKYLNIDPSEVYEWAHSDDENAIIFNTYDSDIVVDYVEEIYGLSLCNCLLAGKSGGVSGACIWNGGKFDHMKILADKNKSKMY